MDSTANAFESTIAKALARWGVSPSAEQFKQFSLHYQMLVEANRSFNLTRIVEPVDAAIKHFADSLAVAHWLNQHPRAIASMLDVGTGAGFPALPLAAMYPKWRVTAIDGTKKKVDFVGGAASAVGLRNVEAVHAHSSHWTSPQKFDLVVLRAVAAMDACVALGSRFVAAGGVLVAYKTADVEEPDRKAAARMALESGLFAADPFGYELETCDRPIPRVLHLFEAGGGPG